MDTPTQLAGEDAIDLRTWDLGFLNLLPGGTSKHYVFQTDGNEKKPGIQSKNKLKIGTAAGQICTVLLIIGDHGAILLHLDPLFWAIKYRALRPDGVSIRPYHRDKSKAIVKKLTKLWKVNKGGALVNSRILFMPPRDNNPEFSEPDVARYVQALLKDAKIPGIATSIEFNPYHGQASETAASGMTLVTGTVGTRPRLFLEGRELHP